jgi:hypothetical protein
MVQVTELQVGFGVRWNEMYQPCFGKSRKSCCRRS